MRKKPPIVPPEQWRIEETQEIEVADGDEECLVVPVLASGIQSIRWVELDFLVDQLWLLELVPLFGIVVFAAGGLMSLGAAVASGFGGRGYAPPEPI
jgi:hypothetical protein